jgi:predicted Zn-dependent protease
MSDRVAQLKEILAQAPGDRMARYALAMEYLSAAQADAAIAELRGLTAEHSDYVPAWQMLGQTLMRQGDPAQAHEVLKQGIAVAERVGNRHAQSEMQGMLDETGE